VIRLFFFFLLFLLRGNWVINIKETRKTKAETRKKQWGRHEKRNERHGMRHGMRNEADNRNKPRKLEA
jgi:hypothetical protein